jgi:hypothetical protein
MRVPSFRPEAPRPRASSWPRLVRNPRTPAGNANEQHRGRAKRDRVAEIFWTGHAAGLSAAHRRHEQFEERADDCDAPSVEMNATRLDASPAPTILTSGPTTATISAAERTVGSTTQSCAARHSALLPSLQPESRPWYQSKSRSKVPRADSDVTAKPLAVRFGAQPASI